MEKHPVVIPGRPFFYSRRVIDKERPNFLVGTGKGQVEYSKLLFTTFHSRITIPVSSASNSFPTEQNSSVAKLYSSPVAPETLISLMSYDVCENTHTHTPTSCLENRAVPGARYLYKYIYLYAWRKGFAIDTVVYRRSTGHKTARAATWLLGEETRREKERKKKERN